MFDKLIDLRNELNILLKSSGKGSDLSFPVNKISFLPILIKITSLSLSKYPILNSTVNKEATEMIQHVNHNIGVAIDSPKGLIVPVIKNVQNKTIFEIAADLNRLQEDAKNGTLKESDLKHGTFSLSNIGSIGGTYAVPVLNIPQTVIGALGRTQIVPKYINKDSGALATREDISK